MGEEANTANQFIIIENAMICAVFLQVRKLLPYDIVNEFKS